MGYLNPKIKASIIIATVTVALDWTFHWFLTEPMETFDYFTVKWLLSFFVATLWVNWQHGEGGALRGSRLLLPVAAGFSFLMSLYYRWWEYFSSVPYGARAPDIIFLNRDNVVLFAGTWFLGHALFFIIGALLAEKLVRRDSDAFSS